MKQYFLRQEGSEELNLFFAGFGQDPAPFLDLPYSCDCALVYDYRSLSFDEKLYSSYANLKLIAWSMGVMMASRVLPATSLSFEGGKLAINGTLEGIDSQLGIDPKLWQATAEQLDESSAEKFYLRLCGADRSSHYWSSRPCRPLAELAEELAALSRFARTKAACFEYDLAIVGSKDRIIPPQSQRRSWEKHHTPVLEGAYAHYQESLFLKVLCS